MSPGQSDQHLDHELLQERLQAAVLRGQLALVMGEDEAVSAWLGQLAVTLSDDTEVVRLDASEGYSAAGLVQDLVNALDVAPDHLLARLQTRASGLPLVLIVDNGECLGSGALHALRDLLARGGGGLGVLVGGESELPELLAEAQLEPAYQARADTPPAYTEVLDILAPENPSWHDWVPWKHLAAVVGLSLLVWLFWPEEPSGSDAAGTALELPPPDRQGSGSAVEPSEAADKVTERPNHESERAEVAASAGTPPGEPAGPEQGESGGSRVDRASPASDAGAENNPAQPGARPSSLDAELAYRGEDWLLTRAPDHWMLQLALAADEERARTLMNRLGPDRGAYYRAQRDGEVVYIVLAGPYESRSQALGARADLPGAWAARGPFPRLLRDIAAEIQDG